ncbi:UDP-glycosyltransferase 73C5-like [Iris pallida]|uniref:UDP-glycosyltransferase 73C5-like n=1 Tax=Iris pallida TaxID=29817 RepID=A0AAX6I3L3_IRIPA|nr:UDP-glycosyltransferase 73C5-like [Iris pallida]
MYFPEESLQRLPKQAYGGEEWLREVMRRERIEVLASLGESSFSTRELEHDESDRDAGSLRAAVYQGLDAGGVGGGGDEADSSPAGGEEAAQVDHGDHVAWGHQRDQNKVRHRVIGTSHCFLDDKGFWYRRR